MSDNEKKITVSKDEFAHAVFDRIKRSSKDFIKECNDNATKLWSDFSEEEYKTLKWESYVFYFWLTSKLLKNDSEVLDIIHEDLFLAPIVPKIAEENNVSEDEVRDSYSKEFMNRYKEYYEIASSGEKKEGVFLTISLVQHFLKNSIPTRKTELHFIFITHLIITITAYFVSLGELRSKVQLV